MTKYLTNVLGRKPSNGHTPQNQPMRDTAQIVNSAGGFAFGVDDWTRLNRFLVLGSEGGSFYANERVLTAENAEAVLRCIENDGPRVVREIVAVSVAGRAPKNDPALFALALCAAKGDDQTRREAFAALPKVARIGTHLFHFAAFVDTQRGWGRGLRNAVANWYNAQDAKNLAYGAIKYQARDGWSHRDLLRLSHPKPASETHGALFHWVTQGWPSVGPDAHPNEALQQVWAMEKAKRATEEYEVANLILDFRLPREAVPTQFLNSPVVWEALLEEMPMTALIRNLATLTRVGVLAPNSAAARKVCEQLTDGNRLQKARVHPIAVLSALRTYASGRGVRGSNTWHPVTTVVDALDAAFYAAFGNVEKTGKRWLLALDVSGSMTMGEVAGVPGLAPRDASAAMALVTAATESDVQIVGFTSATGGYGGQWGGGTSGLTPVPISRRSRLDSAIQAVSGLPFGGTDCALPMVWAKKQRVQTDVFVIYTDSETWAGKLHPVEALRDYRDATGIDAKLIVVGMVSNGFSIADPNDAGMLDVVGFDTATPNLMSDFATGRV